MAKKPRIKKPKLPPLKKKLKGEVYVGNELERRGQEIDSLKKQLQEQLDKNTLQQREIDSLNRVVKIRIK